MEVYKAHSGILRLSIPQAPGAVGENSFPKYCLGCSYLFTIRLAFTFTDGKDLVLALPSEQTMIFLLLSLISEMRLSD